MYIIINIEHTTYKFIKVSLSIWLYILHYSIALIYFLIIFIFSIFIRNIYIYIYK